MIKEIRTLVLLLCAAAFTLGSCAKHSITPEEEQPEVIGFKPVSESAKVKAGTDESGQKFLSDYYLDFGVWGIARHSTNNTISPYILWEDDAFTQVSAPAGTTIGQNSSTPVIYTPDSDAYWLKDYTYNFIAVAPFINDDLGFTLTPNGIVTKEDQEEATSPIDYITFSYDLSGKYEGTPASGKTAAVAPNYTFDLLGAASERAVSTSGYNTSEPLTFWHLFSQINIKVLFKDPNGATLEGKVTGMRLDNVDTDASYTLYYDESNDKNLHIGHNAGKFKSGTISINETLDARGYSMNIVPQNIANVRLYLDFEVGDAEYENFEAKLNFANYTTEYLPNNKYNWTLTISNTLYIKFNASVEDWDEGGPADDNIEF